VENIYSYLPGSGDTLFRLTAPGTTPNVEHSWLAYAKSYKDCADKLVEVCGKDSFEVDIYPIVFLYRHYLELELKSVIALSHIWESVALDGDDARKRVESVLGGSHSHDLMTLLSLCKSACERIGLLQGENFRNSYTAFAVCIEEMASRDPGSFAFRYPVDKKLNGHRTAHAPIDLANLSKTVERLSLFLRVMRQVVQGEVDTLGTADDDFSNVRDVSGDYDYVAPEEEEEE
jgi:hypothetical protein